MPDSTDDRGPQDRSRISMEQEHEVSYWTQRFGVSQDELQKAVDEVGNSATEVERHLAAR